MWSNRQKIALALLVFAGVLLAVVIAKSAECPPGVQRCKVITLTPEEEQVLMQPGGIFEIAERGATVQLSAPVKYFREKIIAAPAGEVKKAEPPKQ